jgi:hypothetical protein
MKTNGILKTALSAIALAGAMGIASQATAISLTYGDIHTIGLVDPGIPANPTDVAGFVNHIIGMSLNTGPL